MKKLVFAVTNDLITDQRMIRICTSLAGAGYDVTLVGRRFFRSKPLNPLPFQQRRLLCFFRSGFAAYAEFNLRLLFFLLGGNFRLVCAIDLDTIIPCYLASRWKSTIRVYDAHELFCEMKEISSRPRIYAIWKKIERYAVPNFKHGYTVNEMIAAEFERLYSRNYGVVRNLPVKREIISAQAKERFVIYQGAVNEGRSFETLIPAMKWVEARLVICGGGNFMQQVRELVKLHGVSYKVEFRGIMRPEELRMFTPTAFIGLTLFDSAGLSNRLSLANRFFDYMHAGVPQICVDFPVYREIIEKYPFAVLLKDLNEKSLATEINDLLRGGEKYEKLRQACLEAREILCWQHEEEILWRFYSNILKRHE